MRLAQAFSRAFPVPAYLATPGAGVDISSGSVRAVSLTWHGATATLGAYRHADLTPGVIVDGEVEKVDALAEVLRSFRLKTRMRYAHASLPERKAFLYEQLVPADQHDLLAAVESELEAHVPLAPAEVAFGFEPARRVDSGTVVAVSAYAKRIVAAYEEAFAKAGVTLESLEVESQALARALTTPVTRGQVILVVDFGRVTTRIAVLDHGVAAFTQTVDVGGDSLTQAVMKAFKVEAPEAEKIKNEKGFLESDKNRELYEALMTTASVLKDELARRIAFWATDDAGGVPRTPVEQVIVVGGNANLKGLPEYLARGLGLPVVVANAWTNAFSLDEYVPELPYEASLEYATAIGLALKSRPTLSW